MSLLLLLRNWSRDPVAPAPSISYPVTRPIYFRGSNNDVIRDQLSGVVGNTGYSLSEIWELRRLISKPGIEPRVYGDWEQFPGLATAATEQETYDSDRKAYVLTCTCRLRVSEFDPETPMKNGDQVRRIKDEIIWAIYPGMISSGLGTKAYGLSRIKSVLSQEDRKGGV